MTEISMRFSEAAARFTEILDAVPSSQWSNVSPCEGWTAIDVVAHVVTSEHGFLAQRGIAPDIAVDEPLAAWPPLRDALQAVLDDPTKAAIEYDGMFGRTTVATTVDEFFTFDLIVHAWDIARATGLSAMEEIRSDELARVLESCAKFGDNLRMPGVCGPEIAVADDASEQDKLLAFLGRTP